MSQYPKIARRGGSYTEEVEEAFDELKGSHQCTVGGCEFRKDIDDYQKHTPSWCEKCDSVTTFKRVDEDQ